MKISKKSKEIADAHIQAVLSKTMPEMGGKIYKDSEEVISDLKAGVLIPEVMEAVETRYASVTSCVLARFMGHGSKQYTSGIYRGFKALLDKDSQ
jgi:hypothetical protein